MENYRRSKPTVIWFLWKQGKSQADIHSKMMLVFSDECPSKSTIHERVTRYAQGKESVDEEVRCGRPETANDHHSVVLIQKAFDNDRRLMLRQLAEIFGISYDSARTIVGDILGMARVSALWLPKLLTDYQKEEQLCKFSGSSCSSIATIQSCSLPS